MNRQQLIVLSLIVCSCHSEIALRIPHSAHHGMVQAPLASSSARLSVVVTDVESGRPVSVERTDATGRFVFAAPPGHYAIAVTSAEGYAFVESVSSDSDPVITLSSNCHRLHAKIAGTLAFPAAIAIARISRYVGDRFVAEASRDGQIVACLPSGGYSAYVEGAITSPAVPITISADTSIVLLAYATSQIQGIPNSIKIDGTDLGSFSRSILGHQIFGLGEANHGTADFFRYRGLFSLELARSGKLGTLLFEADAIGMFAIDDYVMGASINIAQSVVSLRFWITDVYEFLEFLAQVRSYNTTALPGEKLHVLGVDAQRLEPPVQFVLEHRKALSLSDHDVELLDLIAPNHGKAFTDLGIDEQALLSSLLDRLVALDHSANLADDRTRVSIAARSIRHQLGYLSKLGADYLRDQAMADIAEYIVKLNGSRPAALWAHNDHIAREASGAAKSLGQYLSERFGDAYYPIAFLSYSGMARAWDAGGKIGVIPHDLGPAPSYNMEAVIMKATRFPEAAWVSLDAASDALKQWLRFPRYVREFGAAYPLEDTQKLRMFPAAFAAVVVIQHVTASTPTPTGVRKVSP